MLKKRTVNQHGINKPPCILYVHIQPDNAVIRCYQQLKLNTL